MSINIIKGEVLEHEDLVRPKMEQYIRVAAIIIENGKILLARHKKHGNVYWVFPGGRLNYGETVKMCAIRELKEETNFDIEISNLIWIVESIPPDGSRHVVNLFFEGKIVSREFIYGEEEGLEGIEFIPIRKVDELILYPDLKMELKSWILNRVTPIYLGNKWE